ALAEAFDTLARARIERDELVTGRYVDDALVVAVLPIREPAARKLARRGLAAGPFVEPMHPEQFAGARIERDDGAAAAGRRIDDAIDHERRRLQVELAIGA